jgi:ATP-dependent helicase/nuclease subunit A
VTADAGQARAYRIDGRSATRESFYAVACDPRRSVAVEACAGAGKTWMLVSRILRALLDGAEPHEILAITFTRKAAGEMRTRLNEWLLEFSAARCDHARRVAELRARGVDEAEAERLAPVLGQLLERVLAGGRPAEIRTFHAWFSQLLRAAPMELLMPLGLHADMEVVDDLAEHRPAIMRRFHAAVLADSTLSADYRALVQERGRTQARRWLDAAWDKRIEIELADAGGTLEPSVVAAALHWPEHSHLAHPAERIRAPAHDATLRRAVEAMARHKGATCRKQGELLRQALAVEEAPARFRDAHAALYTNEGKPRQNLGAEGVDEAFELLAEIRRACHQQSAHEEHLRLVRLSRALLRESAGYKRSRGLADMADLERCALALLRDATLSGWVQERLDARIRHVLIDEFQDTSPLQWHALHAWLSAYAGAGGGASGQLAPGVFIVGDPKQSIYRFRRAEPLVFDAARAFVVEGLEGSVLACDHTRRNALQVLDGINAVFIAAQQEGEFAGFRRHTTEQGEVSGAGVFLIPKVARPPGVDSTGPADAEQPWRDSLTLARIEAEVHVREPEAMQVALAVQQLVQTANFEPGDIQVLCRKRESLRLVADALTALHVPFAAAEDFVLLDAIEAADLVAVLDVLASPRHSLSLAQALRSPLFGASDDELVTLATAAEPHRHWWAALMQDGVAFSPALRRAARLLAGWHQAARHLPPHDLLDRIVAEGEYRERVAAAVAAEKRGAALGAIDALLGLALTLDGARYATPYNFVRALKRRAIKATAPVQREAVQMLTVHGAKGLEARAVFVIDADPEPKAAESATLLVDWPVHSAYPLQCAFVYSETNCPASVEHLRDREFAARRREELNGLYVAMSRARERLVFSATEPYRRGTERSWWERIDGHAQSLVFAPVSGGSVAAGQAVVGLWALPSWQPLPRSAPTPAVVSATGADDAEAARLGQAVHRVLEWAAPASGSPLPETQPPRLGLAALADAAAGEFAVAAPEVLRLSSRILHSPACVRFFDSGGLRWAGNEVAVAEAGQVLRIDRVVAIEEHGGTVWWVLDYKLHHAPERLLDYRAQLLRYRRAIARLEPGAVVRCAFITGDGALIEISDPA